MSDFSSPAEEASVLVEQGEAFADILLEDMDGPECIKMVRSFCHTMSNWQPTIDDIKEDPVMLGLHCLAAADLFKKAFVKAYEETDGRVKAQEAIRKALGGES